MNELFKIGFLTFSMFDVLDIFIVGTLLYAVYNSLKDSIALQVLFIIILSIGLSFITESLNLKSVNWILRTISDIALISFIIIFQTEIRKFLLIVTETKIFKYFLKSRISETIDEIVDAVKELSKTHAGALIVLTRSQSVNMTVTKGVHIQGIVSTELILAIFNPKSPLHDGAVIVENQTIAYAKCLLPLTLELVKEGKHLGTRHRAALGLSNILDALIIVVSEETGRISIAEKGDLEYNIPIEKFEETLNKKIIEYKENK